MKILKLRALNINSLKGETVIDFETLFGSSALFAITGSTGAGKSTLLDVITCALYGRTARLSNPAELMSKNSAEAMCEVEFEVKGKRYRSSWGQKRARLKYDGKLQQPKMMLQELEHEKILESKVREVPRAVERLCGLDFVRFTQSMMLAQGSFDAFLKAKETERSALLEKITDTKIYTQLSKAAYQKHQTLEHEAMIAREKLGMIKLLDAEEVAQKKKQYAEVLRQSERLKTQIGTIAQQIHWLKRKTDLEQEYAEAQDALAQVSAQKEAQREDFQRVEIAQKAQIIAPLYYRKKELEKRITDETAQLEQLQKRVTALLREKAESQEMFGRLREAYILEKATFHKAKEQIKRARELQTKEEGYLRRADALKKRLKALEEEQKESALTLEQKEQLKTQLQSETEVKEQWLAAHKQDSSLAEQLPLLEQMIDTFAKNRTKLESIQKSAQKKERLLAEEKGKMLEASTLLAEQKELLLQIEHRTREVEEEYLQQRQSAPLLQRDLHRYQQLQEAYGRWQQLAEKKLRLKKDTEETTRLLEEYRVQLEHLAEKVALHEEKRALLSEQKEREMLLQKYEEDRAKLKENEPCFLCGSTEHPFVGETHKHIVSDETEQRLHETVRQIEALEKERRQKELETVKLQTQLQNFQRDIDEVGKQISEIENLFHEAGMTLQEDAEKDLSQKVAQLKSALDASEKVTQKRETLLQEKESVQKLLHEKERLFNTLDKRVDLHQSEVQHSVQEIAELKSVLQKEEQELQKAFSSYGYAFEPEQLGKNLTQLRERLVHYRESESKLQSLQKSLHETVTETTRLRQMAENVSVQINQMRKELETEEKEAREAQEKRKAVLNVLDIDLYEVEITQRFDKAQEAMQKEEKHLSAIASEEEELQKQIARFHEVLQKHRKSFDTLREEFEKKLQESGFAGEKAFLDALLEEEAFLELTQRCEALEKRLTEAKTRKEEKEKSLKQHLQSATEPKENIDKLHEESEQMEAERETLQKELGQIREQLDRDSENRKKHQAGILELEKLEKELMITGKLKEMIGSADGSKFARYAQGITLEQLIVLANRHLKLLTKRYYLERSDAEKQALDIQVVDTFQGNITRSVHTLSGGESFIVSLALALGLSELASQKIRIDSLFLDEGFGTLDEESLEQALNALSILQDNGKMIGVISHVAALKERIPLQINILPKGDGTSGVEVKGFG